MSKLCVPRREAMEPMQFLGIDDPSWPEFAAWAVEHDIYPRLNGYELTIRSSDISVGDWVTITGSSGWAYEIYGSQEFHDKYLSVDASPGADVGMFSFAELDED